MACVQLHPDPKREIAHRQGTQQLTACAGSGKTEVLTNRVATLRC